MNWEEIAAAHDEQTPLVWSTPGLPGLLEPPHREIVAVYRSNPKHPFPMSTYSHEHARVWVVRAGGHQVDARTEDLRPATAQELLELGEL